MTKRNIKIFSTLILCTFLSLTTEASLPPAPPAPDITVTDTVVPTNDLQVPFGDVTEGNSSSHTITIKNDGNAPLSISNIAQANPLAAPFSILNNTCSGQTITPAANCTFTVLFSPTTTGSFNDAFDIPSNDPDPEENSVTINVSGTGLSSTINQPPSIPQPIYPADGQTGLGTTVELGWAKATDTDGDPVIYDLFVCKDDKLTSGCITQPDITAFLGNQEVYYAGIFDYGKWMLLFGIILFLTGNLRKKRKMTFLFTVIITLIIFIVSCGGGGSGGSSPQQSGGISNEVSYTVSGLSAGTTYYWKVVAKDGNGGQTESSTWNFTTQ